MEQQKRTSRRPRVCVLPYGQRLGKHPSRLPLSELHWPLGVPEDIQGQTLADLLPTDHLLTPPHSSLYFRPTFGTRARVSVMIMEPRAVHKKHMVLLHFFRRRFHRILTSDRKFLSQNSNSVHFQTAGSWVPDWHKTDLSKRAMCSLIASGKTKQEGHKLRHSMVQWCRETGQDIDIMGRGYKPFSEKSAGLAPYRYSIVIENAREENYFTEKLVDALLCNTVPIYWGCPNIADFFDTSGMILCETMADLQRAVEQMSEADYTSRLPGLEAARNVAIGYADIYPRAAKTLLEAG
ncbi:glycosyltransferase family 10 domain-containing protein [Lentibacter sp. XHP0401]|uniref:glycosyltransferase family 10 domain-containing protein n=1 Tax=Lentibacter sp. XHP0401 TaxID=2984334 RepID=UPI0021E79E76|nr:glycosyltransferase family 10 [Lentibacter sp. XHP0401]MCV2892261.1 glycosyltransferase family 10 [Lentibacter sp. XHP0401]